MILIIDNYDSFTYNLVQYVGETRQDIVVQRNDQTTLDDIAALAPDHIIISPGPCTPNEAGLSPEIARVFGPQVPLLGVCLGHQCIGQAFGGRIVSAKVLMHGKTSLIHHADTPLFAGIPSPFEATRYHSLAVAGDRLPDCLTVTAWTDDGEIMGVEHTSHPIFGVQFHPESILSPHGKQLLRNFLSISVPAPAADSA